MALGRSNRQFNVHTERLASAAEESIRRVADEVAGRERGVASVGDAAMTAALGGRQGGGGARGSDRRQQRTTRLLLLRNRLSARRHSTAAHSEGAAAAAVARRRRRRDEATWQVRNGVGKHVVGPIPRSDLPPVMQSHSVCLTGCWTAGWR